MVFIAEVKIRVSLLSPRISLHQLLIGVIKYYSSMALRLLRMYNYIKFYGISMESCLSKADRPKKR